MRRIFLSLVEMAHVIVPCNYSATSFFVKCFFFSESANQQGIPPGTKLENHNPSPSTAPARGKKGISLTKRTVAVTAAALMFAGMTSLSLAGEKEHNSVQQKAPAAASDVAESVGHNSKESKDAVSFSNQPAEATSGTEEVAPTNENEKASEPMAENKPAATLSDAVKSTTQAASEQAEETVTKSVKSVKSTVPTPSVPTSPTVEAAKTVVTPTAPTTMPTK